MEKLSFSHEPVLLAECLEGLALKPDGCYVDCTAGGGGHSAAILARLGAGGRLFSLDKDPEARQAATARLSSVETEASFEVVPADFRQITEVLQARGVTQVDGILADLGVSSYQLDTGARGFSYRMDGPLDMRMNPEAGLSAAEWLNTASEDELIRVFRDYGEERYAPRIARAILRRREEAPLETTAELAELISRSMPPAARREKQHPAKRVFQAIRIEVNGELAALESLLDQAPALLAPGGRLAIISFHSLEDRRVKQAYKRWEHPCTCPPRLPCVCGRKPLGRAVPSQGYTATEEEKERNPRARSARVRIFVRNEEPLKAGAGEERNPA